MIDLVVSLSRAILMSHRDAAPHSWIDSELYKYIVLLILHGLSING